MASGTPGVLQRDFSTLFEAGSLTGLTDRDLVERVAGPPNAAAEAAFEVLVTRHGPMVLRVCRNVLGHLEDAEDAFQATFLVLVKQRGSIRKLDSVASWLYGVAARVAARVRVDAARRRKSEQGGIRLAADSVAAADTAERLDQAAFGPIVQEEVRRLPEKYRSVVLLCYWEGLTQEQAAHQLNCPIGTVRSRIARARDLLHRRLARRGLASTAGVVAILSASSVPAAMPLAPLPFNLVHTSVQAAMCVAAGQSTAGVVSASVLLLVRRVLWSLMMMKLRAVGPSIALICLLIVGLGYGAQHSGEKKPDAKPSAPDHNHVKSPPVASNIVDLPLEEYVVEPPDLLLVEVLEALPGRPISGERLVRPDGKISLGFYGDVYVAGLNLAEVKEKVILHLRRSISDEKLGLVVHDPRTNQDRPVTPRESDRVFVDVTAYNSRFFYVQGEFNVPGRFPLSGRETILDAINLAGGLAPQADRQYISLLRKNPKGPLDYNMTIMPDQITEGADRSGNHFLQPGDRLVARRDPNYRGSVIPREPQPFQRAAVSNPPRTGRTEDRYDRRKDAARKSPTEAGIATEGPEPPSLLSLEKRLSAMEVKLDRILQRLEEPER
jgi:polysaccharide export outer membrane protein